MGTLFHGMYEHQLDDKGRLRIPAKFKKGLDSYGNGTYSFVRGTEGRIYVFPDEVLEEKLEEIPDNDRIGNSSKASMLLSSSTYSVEEDGQGRATLPKKLIEAAGIKKDIVTIGNGRRLEIWAAEKYEAYMASVDYDAEINKLGI